MTETNPPSNPPSDPERDREFEAAQELLRRRARRLADMQRKPVEPKFRHRVMAFERAGETYGVPMEQIQEVRRVYIASLPGLPRAVQGLFQIRGSVYSLADLAALFAVGEARPAPLAHGGEALAVVVQSSFGSLGLQADALLGPRQITDAGCGEPPDEDCFLDVTHDLLAVIDVDRLAQRAEFRIAPRTDSPPTTD